jgi:RHS repeat-associated protein
MFTRVGRHNEYYPFGLQTAKSWTRDNSTANNFLANGGTELNPTSNLYDLDFRNYDPVLGRLNQVDPMADKYGSASPYHYSFNNPVSFNDPTGLEPPQGSIAYGTYVPGPQWIAGDQARIYGGVGGGGTPKYGGAGNYFLDEDGNGMQNGGERSITWEEAKSHWSSDIISYDTRALLSLWRGMNYVNDASGNRIAGTEHFYLDLDKVDEFFANVVDRSGRKPSESEWGFEFYNGFLIISSPWVHDAAFTPGPFIVKDPTINPNTNKYDRELIRHEIGHILTFIIIPELYTPVIAVPSVVNFHTGLGGDSNAFYTEQIANTLAEYIYGPFKNKNSYKSYTH